MGYRAKIASKNGIQEYKKYIEDDNKEENEKMVNLLTIGKLKKP